MTAEFQIDIGMNGLFPRDVLCACVSSFDTEQSFAKCVEATGKNCNTKTPLGSAFESELLPQRSKLRTALFIYFFVYFFFFRGRGCTLTKGNNCGHLSATIWENPGANANGSHTRMTVQSSKRGNCGGFGNQKYIVCY